MCDTFIPLSVPNFKGNEQKYVQEAIASEWVSTGGVFITEFEQKLAGYVDASDAVACQSGTAGLHLALLSLCIGPQDAVVVPTLTFIASINPVRYTGATPLFMDCDDSLCMDPDKLECFLENECEHVNGIFLNKQTGKRVRAILVVHVFGNMAHMVRIMDIAARFDLSVIEDAAEALGTHYMDTPVPMCHKHAGTIGDIGVYSFNGNKIITTGGGGMVVAKDPKILSRIKHLSTQAKMDPLNFIHDEVGYNYRMTNVQAALGLAQLEQLERFIQVKMENYNLYKRLFSEISALVIGDFLPCIRPNYWFYCLYLNGDYPRDPLIQYMADNQIQARPVWGLIHEQKPYQGSYCYQIEKAISYQQKIVNIPCSSNLSPDSVERVAEVIKKWITKNLR